MSLYPPGNELAYPLAAGSFESMIFSHSVGYAWVNDGSKLSISGGCSKLKQELGARWAAKPGINRVMGPLQVGL